MIKCECTGPGFCERHNCFKDKGLYQQCKLCPLSFAILEKEITGPNLVQKAVNYTKAQVKHTLSGRKEVTDEVFEERISKCKGCDYFDPEKIVCKHQDCGCFLEIKCKWADSECPIGEWNAIAEEKEKGCGSCGK